MCGYGDSTANVWQPAAITLHSAARSPPPRPRQISFLPNTLYHPQVATSTGELCALDVAKHFGPTKTMLDLGVMLRNILAQPNIDEALEVRGLRGSGALKCGARAPCACTPMCVHPCPRSCPTLSHLPTTPQADIAAEMRDAKTLVAFEDKARKMAAGGGAVPAAKK